MISSESRLLAKTEIFPVKHWVYGSKDQLDFKAICVYTATGFFLDDETFYRNLKTTRPGCEYWYSPDSGRITETKYWNWYYRPRKITLNEAVDEFSGLLETIVREQTRNRNVILPISGGLDSRTQAVALHAI